MRRSNVPNKKEHEMVIAYILITTNISATDKLLEELKSIEEIKEVSAVTGDTDLIVKVEAESMDDVHDLLMDELEKIEHIYSTKTMFAISKLHWER
jgi:DNA-binding Lrp family transcriptional regulator